MHVLWNGGSLFLEHEDLTSFHYLMQEAILILNCQETQLLIVQACEWVKIEF